MEKLPKELGHEAVLPLDRIESNSPPEERARSQAIVTA
jgi:hypothetical protein